MGLKEFELTFKGQGMPYIYERALYKYYLPNKSVSIIKNGVVQEFMHKDMLSHMNKEGLKLTPSAVQIIIKNMDSAFQKSREEIKDILKNPLTPISIKKVFANAGKVTRAYYYFDPHFFDGIFAESHHGLKARKVIELIQEHKNIARKYFNKVHFGNKGHIPQLLLHISKLSEIPFDELQNYNEDELVRALSGRRIPKSILSARKRLYILEKNGNKGNMIELTGEKADTFYKKFYATKEKLSGIVLRGKTAHAPVNLIQGRVKSITRDYDNVKQMYRQMEKMEKGEILVTQTTDPEMMPALLKASAVITDIGGMLSHAAITARELNIPCIVGTKIATQILKDGDLIEVDANQGVVKIIKKK